MGNPKPQDQTKQQQSDIGNPSHQQNIGQPGKGADRQPGRNPADMDKKLEKTHGEQPSTDKDDAEHEQRKSGYR